MTMSEKTFAAYIGLDWADAKHDYCLRSATSEKVEYGKMEHTPALIDQWVMSLKERFSGQPIALCLELKSGPIVSCLLKYDFMCLYFVSPQGLANYRRVFTQSGAKDDPTDAFLQFDFLTKHFSDLKEIKLDDSETRLLDQLTKHRKSFVGEKVKLTRKIQAALKCYYPLILTIFPTIDTAIFCDFIKRWPNLSKLKKARRKTLEEFFKTHRCGRADVICNRIELIDTAIALTDDEAVIKPYQRYALGSVVLLKKTLETVKEYDVEITKIFKHHKDSHIFASFPGAGNVLAPRLLTAFGTDRSVFSSASEVTKYSGIAPVLERSGKKVWIHWRFKCSKFLRQTFVEWANQTIKYSYWAKAFYEEKRAQGKAHQATIRALAFKWIRIMYRCWKNHTIYDESKYLFALKKHGVKS